MYILVTCRSCQPMFKNKKKYNIFIYWFYKFLPIKQTVYILGQVVREARSLIKAFGSTLRNTFNYQKEFWNAISYSYKYSNSRYTQVSRLITMLTYRHTKAALWWDISMYNKITEIHTYRLWVLNEVFLSYLLFSLASSFPKNNKIFFLFFKFFS